MANYSEKNIAELLAIYSQILDELRLRNVIRSKNNPTGDYAEWLVSEVLKLDLEKKSVKGFDAKDIQGKRYQIKGRRITPENKSTQLGVIRNLELREFDYLVAVLFDKDWNVVFAVKIPYGEIGDLAKPRRHVNGHIMHLRESILKNRKVEDISENLRRFQQRESHILAR